MHPLVLCEPPYENELWPFTRVKRRRCDTVDVIGVDPVWNDVDPVFANTEEWYQAIPAEVRPRKDQPFYHLFAENERTHYVAYVSEQNLVPDDSTVPLSHPDIPEWFDRTARGTYELKKGVAN